MRAVTARAEYKCAPRRPSLLSRAAYPPPATLARSQCKNILQPFISQYCLENGLKCRRGRPARGSWQWKQSQDGKTKGGRKRKRHARPKHTCKEHLGSVRPASALAVKEAEGRVWGERGEAYSSVATGTMLEPSCATKMPFFGVTSVWLMARVPSKLASLRTAWCGRGKSGR